MRLQEFAPSLKRWTATLKFKIVAMAVATGMLSALGTTQWVLTSTQSDLNALLLNNDRHDLERTAALMADKVDMLKLTLVGVSRRIGPGLWQDPAAMTRYLEDKPALNALFDNIVVAGPNGGLITRLVRGVPVAELPHIGDRDYFQQALLTDQPVVSEPLLGRATQQPLLVIAVQVPRPDGKPAGVLAGTLALRSGRLFSNLGAGQADGARNIVIDRKGVVLAHPDASRVLGHAPDEPGLAEVFGRWHGSGSPIDTQASATLSSGYMVSMAGIPTSDWVLVRLTPQALAWQPVAAAQRTAWLATIGVGLLAALLAGALAWGVTRPISALRERAEAMLIEPNRPMPAAPPGNGEVGELARAFDQVVLQRQRRQGETQALLQQLEAVLDHAEVGIALTRNGQFELVSRHFCRIFRCDKHDMVGQSTRMIHATDTAYQAFSERALPMFMEHGVFEGEVELVQRSGQPFWAQMRGRAVVAGDRSQGTIWTVEDVTEVREHRERLAWTSNHDSLTGLANRAAFEVLLERATERAEVEPFCALFIDLDRFKLVNDTGGHAAGDALLRDIAHALVAQVRGSDTVARLGGDEFAVLLAGCPLPQALVVAEKLRSAVIDYRLVWEQHSFGVGASIGLVRVDTTFTNAAEVLRAADAACYAAKGQGRNCVAVYGAHEAHKVMGAAVAEGRSPTTSG
ncbi:MAG: hypothetical protein AD742_19800 [Methylibium sp. NZG]|nr:MAG: hypothetical protein AD742_19800 [Methylibium sp. NZG]